MSNNTDLTINSLYTEAKPYAKADKAQVGEE
jgi:hypothetical protein